MIYAETIKAGIALIAEGPTRPGSIDRSEILEGSRSFHWELVSRKRHGASHLLYFREIQAPNGERDIILASCDMYNVYGDGDPNMRSWSITQARARISEVFDAALKSGPQKVERRDSEPVVVVAQTDWDRLVTEYRTMSDLVLNAPIEEADLPKRRPARSAVRDPL